MRTYTVCVRGDATLTLKVRADNMEEAEELAIDRAAKRSGGSWEVQSHEGGREEAISYSFYTDSNGEQQYAD